MKTDRRVLECGDLSCSLHGSPQLHLDRRAERRPPRRRSARSSRHRFGHAHFRIGPLPATLCVTSHLCGVLIAPPPLRGRTPAQQPTQNTAEMGSNAEKPGVTLDCDGKRSTTPLSPAARSHIQSRRNFSPLPSPFTRCDRDGRAPHRLRLHCALRIRVHPCPSVVQKYFSE